MFKPVERKKLRTKLWNTHVQDLLIEFMESDRQIVVVDYISAGYKNVKSCRGSLYTCIKRLRLPLGLSVRENILYLRKRITYKHYD